MVGCARKQVGRAFQGGEWSQTLSEMPGPAFREAPRVYLAALRESQNGKRSAGGSSSKADGLTRNQVPQPSAFFVLLAACLAHMVFFLRYIPEVSWDSERLVKGLICFTYCIQVQCGGIRSWRPDLHLPCPWPWQCLPLRRANVHLQPVCSHAGDGCTIRLQMDDFSQRK